MDYKLTLITGGETWQTSRQVGSHANTFGKSDPDYLTRVVTALTDALATADKQLRRATSTGYPHIPKYE